MDGVVFEEVDQVVNIHEGIVNRSNTGVTLSEAGTEDETTDTAESVNTHTNSAHFCFKFCVFNFNIRF